MGDEQVIQQLLAALDTVNDPRASQLHRQQANEVSIIFIIFIIFLFLFYSLSFCTHFFCFIFVLLC